MRWRGRSQSGNVEDRRGVSPKMAMGGGGGAIAIIVVLLLKFFDAPAPVQELAGQALQRAQRPAATAPAGEGIDDDTREFISVVLHDTETVWAKLFQENVKGGRYSPPKLIIFSSQVQTACGTGQAAMGPFYCPGDNQVYIDPTFFDDLARRHRAPGDFAQAYVIAHEVAHHVQNLLPYSNMVNDIRRKGDKLATNRASVRLELQADFLAGVWAHHAHKEYGILEDGDMEEAIKAANQIGDDLLQKEATGTVIPERFTHGTSAQRVYWFKRGLRSGNLADCAQLFKIAYDEL